MTITHTPHGRWLQEEMEKQANPEEAVLHKLMRMDDAAIRGRILEEFLAPQTKISLPNGNVLPVDPPKPPKVEPMAFAGAVRDLVSKLRGMDANGDVIVATIEDARQVAKEARMVIAQNHEESVLIEFQDSLMDTFIEQQNKG